MQMFNGLVTNTKRIRLLLPVALACLFLAAPSCVDLSELGEEIVASLVLCGSPALFPGFYVDAVWYEAEEVEELDSLYVKDAVRPDHAEVRAALVLPLEDDSGDGDEAIRGVVVELNAPALDTMRDADGEPTEGVEGKAESFLPVADPSEEDGERERFSYTVRFRHNPKLEKDTAILTFEVLATDATTGEPKGQRHRVAFVTRRDPEPEVLQALITSHTVETFVPELSD